MEAQQVIGSDASDRLCWRIVMSLGSLGCALLLAAGALFSWAWPVATTQAGVVEVTVRAYDRMSGTVTGEASEVFTTDQVPAAVITVTTSATNDSTGTFRVAWFNSVGYETNSADCSKGCGPDDPLPVFADGQVPDDTYTFVAGEYQGNRFTEVYAEAEIEVET